MIIIILYVLEVLPIFNVKVNSMPKGNLPGLNPAADFLNKSP